MNNISFNNVTIEDKLFNNRIGVLSSQSILSAIKKCYDTPRVQNFIEANKAINGESATFEGIVYDDADVYKILEGAAYILYQQENDVLEYEMNKLIKIVSEAQESDGYITTKHTIHPEMKWVCLDAHEMYNFGHLIEATIAHYQYSGKKTFLNVGIKAANYLCEHFGNDKSKWIPGHQEIELALLKLYKITENKNYIQLCKQLLGNRGHGYGWANNDYKDKAVFIPNQEKEWNKAYHQDTVPLENLEKVEGHAVRAMYMYTAMAHLAEHNDNLYIPALERVWDNLVNKNMYITGGIGSTKVNEGFTCDYDLPNHSAYCETCASVGMVLWNSRMFEITRKVEYLDVIERELKNGILSGLSIDGKKYFYDNPLESLGDKNRSEWFETSCCPTQLMRFIPQIGNFIYYEEDEYLVIAQIIESSINTDKYNIKLNLEKQNLTIHNYNEKPQKLKIRIPLNTVLEGEYKIENGFVIIEVTDKETIYKKSIIEKITSSPKVIENKNKSAFMYEGFVYCAEKHGINKVLKIPNEYKYSLEYLNVEGCEHQKIVLNSINSSSIELIPYFMWNNRGTCDMKVWIDDGTTKLYR